MLVRLPLLKRVLESPSLYPVYERLVGGRVAEAVVGLYRHPDGLPIEGREGRWWVYVRVRFSREAGLDEYDIALWKLLRQREVVEALLASGALVPEQETEREETSLSL